MGLKLRAFVLVGALGVGGAVITSGDDEMASVVRVIDGDTFLATIEGEEKSVRLLNVDTPELGRNGEDPECMAEEARSFLSGKLTPGAEVELRYDEEKQDRYERELVAVYLGDEMINSEIARQGFGTAVIFEPNDKYYGEVSDAEREAENGNRGIHDPVLGCSLAKQVETTAEETNTLLMASVAAMSAAKLKEHIQDLHLHLNDLRRLLKLAQAPSDFAKAAYSNYDSERSTLLSLINKTEKELADARETRETREKKTREAAAKKAAAAAASERREQEKAEAEQKEQEEVAEKQRQARLQQQPETAAPAPAARPTPAPAPHPAPAPQPASPSGYDGYTGCRAYAGNYALTSVDSKGRPYAKIDCTSKVQIG